MTTSSLIPPALIKRLEQEVESPEGHIRYDIVTLLAFKDDADRCNPISLFWDVWDPRVLTINDSEVSIKPAPALPQPIEGMVLDYLEHLHKRHRVPYEPDADDNDIKEFYDKLPDYLKSGSKSSQTPLPIPPKLKNLVTFLHVAAARAFRIKAYQGGSLSEDALDCLREVERTLDRLNRAGGDATPYTPGFQISAGAAAARAFVELSRVCRREGRHADALRYLARAVSEYDGALIVVGMEDFDEHWTSIDFELWSTSPSHIVSAFGVRTRLIEGMRNSSRQDLVSKLVLDVIHEVPKREKEEPRITTRNDLYSDRVFSGPIWKLLVGNRFVKGVGFGDIFPQEAATTFTELQSSREVNDWAQVREDCITLLGCQYLFGIEGWNRDLDEVMEDATDNEQWHEDEGYVEEYLEDDEEWDEDESEVPDHEQSEEEWDSSAGDFGERVEVRDERGRMRSWDEFWDRAELWVSLQLSPSEYRKLREEDKKNESEERLKIYFFGRAWNILPELAQRRLVNADRTWCSKELGSLEAILNDLRLAVEAVCHEFIWQPLESNSRGEEEWLEFLKLKRELEERGRDPGIRHYTRVCGSRYFEDFLKHRKINGRDIRFLTKDLPFEIRRLADARNSAEHDHGLPWRRSDVTPFFRAFLGIGQTGVLPELARIGRRLRFRQTD